MINELIETIEYTDKLYDHYYIDNVIEALEILSVYLKENISNKELDKQVNK